VRGAYFLGSTDGWTSHCGTSMCEFEGVGLMTGGPRPSHAEGKRCVRGRGGKGSSEQEMEEGEHSVSKVEGIPGNFLIM